jgi:molecular chaperone DnaK
MSEAIGIDLGTTNSCAAIIQDGEYKVIPDKQGYTVIPSVVAVGKKGVRLVGQAAKRQAVTNPENTIFGIKRLIGRRWESEETRAFQKSVPFKLIQGPYKDPRVCLKERVYTPCEISAMILEEIKLVAEKYLDSTVKDAVITVPAYFNHGQRQATKAAGEIAGLNVIRIINEPTAAALAYGIKREKDRIVAVYDLGGGTFDISLLEVSPTGVFKVLATAGDTYLGGEDIDQKIVDWLVREYQRMHGIDLKKDPIALLRLKEAAEEAKKNLSTAHETLIEIPFILPQGPKQALHYKTTFSRRILESLSASIITRTIEICEFVIKKAGISKDEIADVLLVGGQTRMPKLQEQVAEFFEQVPRKDVHPEEVVAHGAALLAHSLTSGTQEVTLIDVTPHSLGIMVQGGKIEKIIPQNTPIPTAWIKTFSTSKDNQTSVRIPVIQGNKEPTILNEFILHGLPKAPKGEIEIEVTFEINTDGIINLRAQNKETKEETSITVDPTEGIGQEELKQIIEQGKKHLKEKIIQKEDPFKRKKQEVQRLIEQTKPNHNITQRVKILLDELELIQDQQKILEIEKEIQTIIDTLKEMLAWKK